MQSTKVSSLFTFLITLGAFLILQGTILPAGAQTVAPSEPPAIVTRTMRINGRQLTLDFVQCPKGTLVDLKPPSVGGEVTPSRELPKPLDILQTEVSYGQFRTVVGDTLTNEILNTNIAKESSNKESASTALPLWETTTQEKSFRDDFPMFGVTLTEAIRFCQIVEKADPGSSSDKTSVSSISYRLPTHLEWQYACRTATMVSEAVTKRDFHRWPGLTKNQIPLLNRLTDTDLQNPTKVIDAFLAIDVKGPWNDTEAKQWPDINPSHKIDDFQSGFVSIASHGLYGIANAQVTSKFGLPICSVTGAPRKQAGDPNPVEEQYFKNDWQIYHLLGNVSELALADDDIQGKSHYFIEGGGQTFYQRSKEDRNQVFIWGGQRKPIVENENSEEDLLTKRKRTLGFRIVRTEDLREQWFAAIRNIAFDADTIAKLEEKLDYSRRTVTDLGGGRPYADKIQPIVEFYQTVARFEKKELDSQGVADQLKGIDKLSTIDPYFAYLSKVMAK